MVSWSYKKDNWQEGVRKRRAFKSRTFIVFVSCSVQAADRSCGLTDVSPAVLWAFYTPSYVVTS